MFVGKVEDSDPKGAILEVQYRVDGGEWLPTKPLDGTFNSLKEEFTFTILKPLGDGLHLVEVKAKNKVGVWNSDADSTKYRFTIDTSPWKRYNFIPAVIPPDFKSSSSVPWSIDGMTASYRGSPSIRSGRIPDGQASEITLSLDIPTNMTISFNYKVSSEGRYDFLIFLIDGKEINKWSGEIDWKEFKQGVTDGKHTFTWRYVKDKESSRGQDAAWVDFIELR